VYVVGRRSRATGRAVVLIDGRRRGTISFRSRRSRQRVVLFTRAVNPRRRHRLQLIALSGRVELDGFAFRR
jgi:hypothetical protein